MIKNLLTGLFGLSILIAAFSCSKSDTNTPAANTITGKWNGSITGAGGPSRLITFNFKTGGSFAVDSSSTSITELAVGTWTLAADSARATFTYLNGILGTYSIAGKYSADFTTMTGTQGINSQTSGYGTFAVAK